MNNNDLNLARILWNYLRYEESTEKTDIIIGLGSADIRTAEWCAYLYNTGVSSKILFTGSRGKLTRDLFNENEADLYAKTAISLGVPAENIIIEPKATNTGENIRYSYDLLQKHGMKVNSLTLVTKPYMLRRAFATFIKQWPDKNKPDVYCSSINLTFDEYCNNAYYPYEYVINVMIGDLQRIREYPKLGFQIEQNIPDEVWDAWELLVKNGYTKHLLK